jgi:hypothetical protein
MLSPNIQLEDGSDFSHIDKNTSMTNLKWRTKDDIDEVGQARAYLRANNILNNPEHYTYKDEAVLIKYEEQDTEEGGKILIPIREVKKVRRTLYPLTKHNVDSRHMSFVITASAREGHLINKAISNRIENVKSETVQDKTQVQTSFFGKKKND